MADLNDMTVDELYEVAQERDIEGRSEMDKAELVAALEADGFEPPADESDESDESDEPADEGDETSDEPADEGDGEGDDEPSPLDAPTRDSDATLHAVPDPDAEVRAPEPTAPRDTTSEQRTPQKPAAKAQMAGAKPKDPEAWTPQNPPKKAVLGITVSGQYGEDDAE